MSSNGNGTFLLKSTSTNLCVKLNEQRESEVVVWWWWVSKMYEKYVWREREYEMKRDSLSNATFGRIYVRSNRCEKEYEVDG